MGFLSKFEGKMEDTVEGAAEKMSGSSLSPVQIAKKAEKQMRREKTVGAGNQYAPTLYTVLVSPEDDRKLSSYYPTLAGETETYLSAKAAELGFVMDGQPLVRFIADPDLKRGKFDVVAEMVASALIVRLRNEEMARYGIATNSPRGSVGAQNQSARPVQNRQAAPTPRQPMNPAQVGGMPMGAMAEAHAAMPVAAQVPRTPQPQPQPVQNAYASNMPIDNSRMYPPRGQGQDALYPMDDVYDDPGYSDMDQPGNIDYRMDQAQPLQESPLDAYLYDEERDVAYVLTGNLQYIGRESSNDIVIPDINASRSHATIHMENDGTWIITDSDSMNGVFVNGRQVSSAPLRDADMIRIGTTNIEFQLLS